MRAIRIAATAAALSLLSLLPSGASAAFIFDQSVLLTHSSLGFLSDPDGPNQVADDFQFAGDRTVTGVRWWGVYENNFNLPVDMFAIRIFGDIGGAPGINPLYELLIEGTDAGRIDTGINNATGRDIYAYSADITPLLLAGDSTYWLSIVQNAEDSPFRWFWMFAADGNAVDRPTDGQAWGNELITPNFPNGITEGFRLVGIPEPSTWALFSAGLLGIGWMNRRKSSPSWRS
jgi:hypothetical protein